MNPSEDALAQIDHPAEDNTWHEAPDLSKGNIKSQFQSQVPFGKKEAKETVGDATQAAHPTGARDPADAADVTAQQGTTDALDTRQGAATGAQVAKEKASANMDDDQKEKMREYRARTKEYFKGKMPKERRDQIVFRLKKMIVEIQGHEDCKSLHNNTSGK